MEFGYQAASSAWRRLAGSSQHGDVQVVVNPDSWLAPKGWIGIVAIGQTVTASVPTLELRLIVKDVLDAEPHRFTGRDCTLVLTGKEDEVVQQRWSMVGPPTATGTAQSWANSSAAR